MKSLFEKVNRFLELPVSMASRGFLVLAVLLLVPTYLYPLWKLTMFAPQYGDGLRMEIYSWKLEGGNGGQDVKEINVLNHYIGMKDLTASDFTEFKWIPFVIGALAIFILRGVLIGRMVSLVDNLVLFLYFGLFSLWSFAFKLWTYGHNLAPTAAVKVPPFMPPLLGYKKLANFEVYSYPGIGSYALLCVFLLLAGAIFASWRAGRARLSSSLQAVA